MPVIAPDPDHALDPAAVVDVQAAFFVLGPADAGPALEAPLELASHLPSASVFLVLDGLPEEELSVALGSFAPAEVLQAPVAEPVLEWVLARHVGTGRGRGAREQHRPARALLGVSTAIRRVIDEIGRVAPARISVLILGETGTGKELVARAIHDRSPRRHASFVAVNCGALPDTLLESELFGHRRGAFTGASRDREGLFEAAHGGTLFLDEVAEMSSHLQVKLLRVLETGEVRRIGDNADRLVDVRVVSATHRDLASAIEEGSFREDLFYRLNGAQVSMPPLRRRRVDIPFLAQHFAEEFGAENARQIALGEDFLEGLSQRDFPGNVRELRNAVERAITLAEPGQTLGVEDLPPDPYGRPAFYAMGTLADRIAQLETQAIQEALERCEGNKTHAARALGVSRLGLRKKMKRLGLLE